MRIRPYEVPLQGLGAADRLGAQESVEREQDVHARSRLVQLVGERVVLEPRAALRELLRGGAKVGKAEARAGLRIDAHDPLLFHARGRVAQPGHLGGSAFEAYLAGARGGDLFFAGEGERGAKDEGERCGAAREAGHGIPGSLDRR